MRQDSFSRDLPSLIALTVEPTERVMVERKRKIGVIGAGPEGMEILGLLHRDKALELSFLMDPDMDSLGLSLKDYGFVFSEDLNINLSDSLTELPRDLDLIINASSDPKIRRELKAIELQDTNIIKSSTARLLWRLKLLEVPRESSMKKARQSLCRQKIDGLLESLDPALDGEEFFYFLLHTTMEATCADTGSIMLIDNQGFLRGELFCGNPDFNIPLIRTLPLKIGKGVPGRADAIGKPLLISGDEEVSGYNNLYRDSLSSMSVPLKDDEGGVLGVLNVVSGSAGAFNQEDLSFLTELVSRTGKYLKKIMTAREMQEVSLEQTFYKDIHSILESEGPINEKLQKAAACMSARLRIASCSIYLRDQSGDLNLQASIGICSKVFGLMSLTGDKGIVGRTCTEGNPTLLQETFQNGTIIGKSRKGLLCLPLSSADKRMGAVLFEFITTKDLTPRRMKFLQEITGLLAAAIRGDIERQRISQKLLKLSVLNEEGLALLSTMERVKVLKLAVASAAMITDAEIGLLKLIDPLSKELILVSTYGFQKDQSDKDLLEIDRRIAEKVRKSGRSLLIPDITRSEFGETSVYVSGLIVPLTEEDQFQGTLSVYNKFSYSSFSAMVFTEDDKEILGKYAHYVNKALKNLQSHLNKESLITIDELTRLKNERYLRFRLPEEIKRADRHKRSLSILFIDVENFEDSSRAMDQLSVKGFLNEIAQALKETFRNIDVVTRLRGAKFAILMPDTGNQIDLAIERLRSKAESIKLDNRPVNLLVGHATYSSNGQTVKDFISKAAKLKTL